MSSVEPEQYANQGHGGKERVGELVVAGCDGAILFELAEKPLDEIAFAIEGKIGIARRDPIGLGWNDRHDASALELLDQGIGIIGLVGQEGLGLDLVEQRRGLADIGRLSRRERQGDRIAERIDDGMDLRGQPAARPADGLIFAFFFLAPALC